jgi:PAS domain S-box-containing protein
MSDKKRSTNGAKKSGLLDPSSAWPALIDACPLAVIGLDSSGNVLLWNSAAERIFGWTADEVLSQPLPTIPSGSEYEFRMILESQMHDIRQQGRDVVRRRKDGALIQLKLWTAPLRDAEGRIRQKAEQEFRDMQHRLNGRAFDR